MAVKGQHAADGFREIFGKLIHPVPFDDAGNGEKPGEILPDGHRTGAGPAAPVGRGKGLVEVQVQDVHADLARPHDAQDGVHVGPVAVDETAPVVDDPGDLADVLLEETQGVGVGDHDPRRLVVHQPRHDLRER